MWLFTCTENELKVIWVKKNTIDITESFRKEDAKTSAFTFLLKGKDVRRYFDEIAFVKISVFIQYIRGKKTILLVSYVLQKRAHENVPTTIIH